MRVSSGCKCHHWKRPQMPECLPARPGDTQSPNHCAAASFRPSWTTHSCTRSDFLSEYNIHLLTSHQPNPGAQATSSSICCCVCAAGFPRCTQAEHRGERRAVGSPADRILGIGNAGEFNKTHVKPLVCDSLLSRMIGNTCPAERRMHYSQPRVPGPHGRREGD